MKTIYNHDMKHYKATECAMLIKTITILIVSIIFATVAYMSEQDYQECLAGNKSVVLCGGGNTK